MVHRTVIPRQAARTLTALLALASVTVATSCSSGHRRAVAASSPAAAPTTSPSPKPKPKPKPKPPATNPLTGLPGTPTGPVIAVKIDNTRPAQPQLGLESADVVYVELVEAGLTRLIAVFASQHPTTVGPVRSVRDTDPEVLGGYGKPALAFSGGAGGPKATLHRSPLIDASVDRFPATYRRLTTRYAPYNLVTNLQQLAAALPTAARVKDVGFRFALRDARLVRAKPVNLVNVVIGQTTLTFRWDAASHRWLRLAANGTVMHTASGAPVSTPNLVIERCPVRPDPADVDVNGVVSQYTSTVGHGAALELRDGRVLTGTWQRASASAPTRYLDAAGKDLLLRPGGAWVLLAPVTNQITYG